jgi:hypothetical protein
MSHVPKRPLTAVVRLIPKIIPGKKVDKRSIFFCWIRDMKKTKLATHRIVPRADTARLNGGQGFICRTNLVIPIPAARIHNTTPYLNLYKKAVAKTSIKVTAA